MLERTGWTASLPLDAKMAPVRQENADGLSIPGRFVRSLWGFTVQTGEEIPGQSSGVGGNGERAKGTPEEDFAVRLDGDGIYCAVWHGRKAAVKPAIGMEAGSEPLGR